MVSVVVSLSHQVISTFLNMNLLKLEKRRMKIDFNQKGC